MSGRDLRKFVNFHRTAIGAAGRDKIPELEINHFILEIYFCIFTMIS